MLQFALGYLSRRSPVIYRVNSTRSFSNANTGIKSLLEGFIKMRPKASDEENELFVKSKYSKNYTNIVEIEVVGSGARGNPKAVFLICGKFRYLFNCGEGTHRLSIDSGIKILKWPHVFITYPSWENVSGLMSFCLSAQSSGSLELFLHAHNSVAKIYLMSKHFMFLKRLKINLKNCNSGESYYDGVLNVKYVRLYPSNPDSSSQNTSEQCSGRKDAEDSQSSVEDFVDVDNFDANPTTSDKKRENSETRSPLQEEKFALSFICQTNESLGSLNIRKCFELGIKPGPLLGLLKEGNDITLDDGTVVKSSEVTSPRVPGAVVIVVECPSENYLDSLLEAPDFSTYQNFKKSEVIKIAPIIIHFSSSQIVKHPKYQEWIRLFGDHVKHLYVNDENDSMGVDAVYQQQFRLNILHPELFPLLPPHGSSYLREKNAKFLNGHMVVKGPKETSDSQERKTEDKDWEEEMLEGLSWPKEKKYFKCVNNNHIKGENFCHLYIKPVRNYDFSCRVPAEKEAYLSDLLKRSNFASQLERFKQELNEVENAEDLKVQKYPKLLFLGTGSSQPNRRRNASGILLFLDEKNLMLLDCGEGTYGQMVRFFGEEKVGDILRRLNIIYLSHMHVDHHFGLITVLKERKSAFEEVGVLDPDPSNSQKVIRGSPKNPETMYILAPKEIKNWLNLLENDFGVRTSSYELIWNSSLMNYSDAINALAKCLDRANLKVIRTTAVKHCRSSYGVAVTHTSGWKLTYSGDTMPSQNLVNLGYKSDILIHEATMDDSLTSAAKIKLHSTMSQAVQVGMDMKAEYIVLTHFSQRYSHIPFFSQDPKRDYGIAFDNMLVCFNQLPLLQKMNKAFKFLFSENHEKLSQRQEVTQLKRKIALPNSPPMKSKKRSNSLVN